jgi:type IV secretory pathway VirB3-like protein
VTFCPLVSIFGVPVTPHPAVATPIYKVVVDTVGITTEIITAVVAVPLLLVDQIVIPEIFLVGVTGGA